MKSAAPFVALASLAAFWVFSAGGTPSAGTSDGGQRDYMEGPASADGIGKFFHGREIAKVMGHPGIGWLERDEREREEAPGKAIAALTLKRDETIADIGAGSGYYAFRIAPLTPEGKVIAVDIQQEMLDFLHARAGELGVSNVEPHLGAIDDLKLPDDSLDSALMVDAYHEFSHPREMLESLIRALKPGGRIYLLEFRGEDDRVPIKRLHKMTEAQARLEFESAGFHFVENRDHLPWQHFMVFQKPHAHLAEMEALVENHGLTGTPLLSEPFRQGWRNGKEEGFEPGHVRLYADEDSFHVLAVLRDNAIGNDATGFNEKTWLTGDVFEIFIEPDSGQYYEFHITPENRNLFLRFTPELFASVRRGDAELAAAHIEDPAFIESATHVDSDNHHWTVYARIPFARLERDGSGGDARFRVAFARYDATPGSEEPVLSATPRFPEVNFHDREAWHSLNWPKPKAGNEQH